MGSSPVLTTTTSSKVLDHAFIYGTLMADEVIQILLKRVPQSSPAILNGFHRYKIKGQVYPAILPVENKSVSGMLVSGITAHELYVLDKFEDVEYERCTVEVLLPDNSTKTANAYVWADKNDPNLYGEWNYEEWRQSHLEDFIKVTKEFIEELEKIEPKPRVVTFESFYQNRSTTDDSTPPPGQ